MPPSGFSQKAVNGLLTFVRATYEETFEKHRGKSLSEEEHISEMERHVRDLVRNSAPRVMGGSVSKEGIEGLADFVAENFKDLVAEIRQGKKIEGKAIQAELDNIGDYLIKFKL